MMTPLRQVILGISVDTNKKENRSSSRSDSVALSAYPYYLIWKEINPIE